MREEMWKWMCAFVTCANR